MESGLMMVLHSAVIGVIVYVIMVMGFNVEQAVAEDRSVLLAALVLAYMVMFGHGLPTSINKNLI